MALAAIPIAEMAGSTIAPALESMVGKETYDKLAPLAKEGLHKIVKSKAVKNVGHKLANSVFGKSKTARKLAKVAKKSKGIVKTGLKAGADLGIISEKTKDNIMGGYDKALSLHDKLSEFNTPKDKAPVQQVEVAAPTISPKAIASASDAVMEDAPPQVVMGHALSRDENISEKEKKLGDILELMGLKL